MISSLVENIYHKINIKYVMVYDIIMSTDISIEFLYGTVPLEDTSSNSFVGTGFFYECEHPEEVPQLAVTVIVTNRHVVEGNELQFRVNLDSGRVDRYKIGEELEGLSCNWVFHPDESIDLAIALAPAIEGSITRALERVPDDVNPIRIGREVVYTGFPMGNGSVGFLQHKPIIRSGIVAQEFEDKYLIDGNVFPGSSGSPVLTRPRLELDENGSINYISSRLIGVISSYIPYKDYAISVQTGRTRVVFEDNSGLAYAYKIEKLHEIMQTDDFTSQANPIIKVMKEKLEKMIEQGYDSNVINPSEDKDLMKRVIEEQRKKRGIE